MPAPLVGVGGSWKVKTLEEAALGVKTQEEILTSAFLGLGPHRLVSRARLLVLLAVLATLEALPSSGAGPAWLWLRLALGDGSGMGDASVSRYAIHGSPSRLGGGPRALMHSLAFFTSCGLGCGGERQTNM